MTVFAQDFDLKNDVATQQLGARLAVFLKPGDVLGLRGGLGAGKTSLARGFLQALIGEATEIPSPTYTLIQVYETDNGEVWHGDMYRLKQAEECEELGLLDAFEDAICLIEWPDKLESYWPEDALDIILEFSGEGRRATLTGSKEWIMNV